MQDFLLLVEIVIITCRIHLIRTIITLVLLILTFEKIRVKLSKSPVEIKSQYLWIPATEYILREESDSE